MRITSLDECCLSLTDAEDKLSSLRLRKVRQMLRWLESISVEYMDAEGISETDVEDMRKFLEMEEWMRSIHEG